MIQRRPRAKLATPENPTSSPEICCSSFDLNQFSTLRGKISGAIDRTPHEKDCIKMTEESWRFSAEEVAASPSVRGGWPTASELHYRSLAVRRACALKDLLAW